jgi:flavin reductase (DIM6/NTAB) family NADH-FMN oxidoreductase RutF
MVDVQAFKSAMSQMATGVTLVTAFHDNTPFGMTASSFTSVSDNPPKVSVCIAERVATATAILKSNHFAVNILGYDQMELGKFFADPSLDMHTRFAKTQWAQGQTKSPVLPDALGWFDCVLAHAFDAGDHYIFVGEVLTSGSQEKETPAIYYHRKWRQIKDERS